MDRLWFDQALRDITMLYKETPWDAGRRIGEMLQHVWVERHDPRACIMCAKAEAYVSVLGGALRPPER